MGAAALGGLAAGGDVREQLLHLWSFPVANDRLTAPTVPASTLS
jgi:hypothetical protein